MANISLIKIVDEIDTWEHAIQEGVSLLVNNDIATPELADKIIESTNQYGPYYVLLPGVALAHTQFGPYNKKVGISLIVFRKPIAFSDQDHHKVNLLFTLSATDADSHLSILQAFASKMGEEGIVEKILSCNNTVDIYELVKDFL